MKLVTSKHPEELLTAYETGITSVILPEFDLCMETEQHNPHHLYNVGMHTIHAMEVIPADKVLRLAMLFHDMGKPVCRETDERGIDHFHGHPQVSEEITGKVLRRLKFDNDTVYMVKKLVRCHDQYIPADERGVRRAMWRVGEDAFPLLLQVKKADMEAQSTFLIEEKEKNLQEVGRIYQEILEKKQCVSLKTLAVNGKDLMDEAGYVPGKELGTILQELLQLVIEEPELNDKGTLLKEARQRRNR